MKHLRTILLGALLAALMAPAAASAAPTTVCTVSTSPCPAANIYAGPIGFELARTGAVATEDTTLAVNGFTIKCTTIAENGHGPGGEGSDGMGSILVNPGAPVTGNINSLWFFNCTETTTGGTACTVTTDAGAPLWPDAITNVPLAAGSNGTLSVNFNLVTVTCGPPVSITCNFGPGAVQASWYNPANPARPDTTGPDQAAAQFHFAGVTLPSASSACTNATWKGNYALRAGADTTFGANLWVQ
jgi:hypothetical protein